MNILKSEVKLDANNLYKLILTVDKLPETQEEVIFQDEEHKLVYGETPDGYVTYGAISKQAHYWHEPGYRWSSRASVLNGKFGKRCMEVTIIEKYRYAGNMTVDAVLPFLPDNFYIIEQVETNSHGKIEEISYYITNSKNEHENSYWFGDITYHEGGRRYIRNRFYNNSALHPDLYTITSAYKRGLMDNDMLKKACSDIANSGKYSLYELNKFASDMENNFAMIKSMKFFRGKSGNILFCIEEQAMYDVDDNEEDIIACYSEDNTSNQSPNYIPYPDQFPHLTRQSIVETILDMWLSYKDIEYIKEYWLGFWKDPLKYKDSAIASMIQNDIRERMT